jgi:photosystem II stability/assembly factor-like uncharacterized protein
MSYSFRLSLAFVIMTLAASQLFAQGSGHFVKNDEFDDGMLEKARNEYWSTIRTSGEEKDLSKIEMNAFNVMHSMENRSSFKSLSNPAWIPIGGSQAGHNNGRVRDVTADPNTPNVVYIATSTGGVWKTPDITAKPVQWISLSDRLPTLMCGAITFAPPNTLILGTGEADGDGYRWPPGVGLFKSSDGGTNWTLVSSIGKTFSQIIVDQTNPQVIYAAYNNNGFPAQSGGILKSTDGGDTWRKLALSLNGPISVAYNAIQPLTIVAGGFGSISRSTDSGSTWAKVTNGLPVNGSGVTVSRISVANAPSDPNLFYASIGEGTGGSLLGVWMSTDAGASWKKMMGYDANQSLSPTNINPFGQAQYWCNSIAVRPSSPKQIYVAGLDLYTSPDSGKDKWQQISFQYTTPESIPNSYIHADHHRLVFLGNVFYDCGDGGLARSTGSYTSWSTDMNAGLATLEFVGVDADNDFTFVSGGCQDNSTNRALVNATEFTATRGGDGGRGWVSPDDPSIVYTTYIRTTFYKSEDGGINYNGNNPIEQNTDLYRINEFNSGSGEGSPFYPAYDASTDGSIVAFGGNVHMWMSFSGGQDGFTAVPKSKSTQVGTVNAVHVFQGESQTSYMWAGAGNNVWRSEDQGLTWASKGIGELVEGITSNPKNHSEIFVVTQGIGASQKHFFHSTDGGATFTNPATNFPNIGCWSVAYSPVDGNIYVGTDKGVLYSYDHGVTWNPLMNGMPMVEVLSLRIKGAASDKLLAGTYGRGVFWIDASQLTGVNSSSKDVSQFLSLEPVNPNPISSSNATIHFTVKDPGLATITLHDILGRELRTLEKSYVEPGRHQVALSTSGMESGTYFVRLMQNGRSISEKIALN